MDPSQLPPGFVLDTPQGGSPQPAPDTARPKSGTSQAMEAALRAKWPDIQVTSDFRTEKKQRELIRQGKTKATNSFHLDDMAVDFVGGPTKDEAVNYLSSLGWNLKEHLDEGDHKHIAADSLPSPPEGFTVDEPADGPTDDAPKPLAPDLNRDAYVETVQNMFDHGFPAEAMQSYAKGVGAPPIDEKRLKDAIAYRDRGGKNQKFELKPGNETAISGTPDLGADPGALGAAALSGADSATLGVLPRIAAAGISLGAGADRNDPSIWNGHSLSDAYDQNLKQGLSIEDRAAAEHPTATTVGALGGAAVPIVPGLGAARGFSLGAKSARLAKLAKASTKGAQVGAVYGGLNAAGHTYSGDPSDIATNAAEGAGQGAVAGAVLSPAAEGAIAIAPKVISKLSPTNRFVSRQAAKNPHAAYDAGIAQDLTDLPNRVSSPIDPNGRAKVTVKEVNALGRSYSTGMKDQINALDLPKARKAELSRALTDWLTMSDDQIAALRGDTRIQGFRQEVYYHGSPKAGIADFEAGDNKGLYFTEDPKKADRYSTGYHQKPLNTPLSGLADLPKGTVYPVRLKFKNAFETDKPTSYLTKDKIDELKSQGYDAIRNTKDKETIVFDKNQIIHERDFNALKNSDIPGNAIADAIVSTKRLYKLTPEIKPKGSLGEAMDLIAPIAGTMADGVTGGLAGSALGRMAKRALFRPADAEAARVNSAEKIIKRSKAYTKLQETVGQSPRAQSQKDLQDLYDTTVTGREDAAHDARVAAYDAKVAREDAKAAKAAAPPQAPKSANAAMMRIMGADTSPPAPPPPPQAPKAAQAGLQRLIQAAHQPPTPEALPKLKMAPKAAQAGLMRIIQADTTPPVPKSSPLPKAPKPLPPEQQAIEDNIAKGIPGQSRVQQAFADRLGTDVPTMLKALEQVAPDYPGMASEIRRIQNGYPTLKSRGLADALVPAMKKTLESSPGTGKIEAAVEKVKTSQKAKSAAEKVAPRSADPVLRRIDRPAQWEESKSRWMKQATQKVTNLRGETRLSTVSRKALADIPEQVRDNFKTAEEAKAFISELEATKLANISDTDRKIIVEHLNSIAETKPYQTIEQYERGTRALRK